MVVVFFVEDERAPTHASAAFEWLKFIERSVNMA